MERISAYANIATATIAIAKPSHKPTGPNGSRLLGSLIGSIMRSRAWIDPDGEELRAHDQTGRDPQGIDDRTINIGLNDAVLLLEMKSRAGADDRETAHASGETRRIICRQQLDLVGTNIGTRAAIRKMARLDDRAASTDMRSAPETRQGRRLTSPRNSMTKPEAGRS